MLCLVRIQFVNTRLLTRYPIPVRIIRVECPSFFWVRLLRCQEDFEATMEALNRRMKRKGSYLHLPPEEIIPKENVLVKIKDTWYRAEINYIHDNSITVELRDWAVKAQIPMTEVYYLEDQFCRNPWQAITCSLANFQPNGKALRWPRRVRELTKYYMKGLSGRMRIRLTTFDFGAIILFDINQESEYAERDLTELLIKMGCGECTDKIQGSGLSGI